MSSSSIGAGGLTFGSGSPPPPPPMGFETPDDDASPHGAAFIPDESWRTLTCTWWLCGFGPVYVDQRPFDRDQMRPRLMTYAVRGSLIATFTNRSTSMPSFVTSIARTMPPES